MKQSIYDSGYTDGHDAGYKTGHEDGYDAGYYAHYEWLIGSQELSDMNRYYFNYGIEIGDENYDDFDQLKAFLYKEYPYTKYLLGK